MFRFFVVFTLASLGAAGLVQADTLSLAEIRSRNGVLLSLIRFGLFYADRQVASQDA